MAGMIRIPQRSDRIRILYLAANPATTHPLALGREIREILRTIKAARYREQIEIIARWAVRPYDMLQALLEVEPHILHFSGHATAKAQLVLEGAATDEHPIDPSAIVDLINILTDNLRAVILNACDTVPLARALTSRVDCVVGMARAIEDEASIEFSTAFYQAIGFGRSLRVAFELGLSALKLGGISGSEIPKLVTRDGVDPANLFLLSELAGQRGSHTKAKGWLYPDEDARHLAYPAVPLLWRVFYGFLNR